MKLNHKVYQTLENPVEIQEVDGRNVEIHYMNDTAYLSRYAGKGQFSVWASNGGDFKLLIEKGYYEELKPLFGAHINGIWIRFFERVQKIRQDLFRKIVLPILLGALVVIGLFTFVKQLEALRMYAVLAMLVVVLFVNVFQSSYMRKKVEVARSEAVTGIKEHLGLEQFQNLVSLQSAYYEKYFKFEDEVEVSEEKPVEEQVIEEPEVLEAEVEEVHEDNKQVDE